MKIKYPIILLAVAVLCIAAAFIIQKMSYEKDLQYIENPDPEPEPKPIPEPDDN